MKDNLLATEIDRLGRKIEIYHSTKLEFSPAYAFFLKEYAKLIEKGHAFPVTVWNDNTCGVVYACLNNTVIGASVYDTDNPMYPNSLWIILTALDDSAKNKGIFSLIAKHRDQVCLNLGKRNLVAHVHDNNQIVLRIMKTSGWKSTFQVITKKVN